MTVLFADVKGSMELAEQMDPEEWSQIMQRFFQILSEGVERFEGFVDKFTGDGIMALFGAPLAHEDHAQRACYAALHLRDELRRHADELRRNAGLNFSVRMGLNSGEVVVGKIGDDLRMDYTAQGHTVGLAARMEQLAAPDRINLSERTAALVSGYFALRDLGPFIVKGVRDPLHVYELEGVGTLRTRVDVSRARGFSKFVGRGNEMATLDAALERAAAGNGQVVGVVAEPGVGKSRLYYEFLQQCRARGLAVYGAHGVAHGKQIPLLPVLQLLRAFFGVADQDAPEEVRRNVAGTLLLLDEAYRPTLPLVFDFIGVPDPQHPAPRMDPEARQRQLFSLVRRLLQTPTGREPTVLVMEDLHWIDGGTEAFLQVAVEALPATQTLLLLNFRPEYHAPWMQKSHYQQLPLSPLGRAAIDELLTDLLGVDASLRELRELIRERTAGNPFFIEEVVQGLCEQGILVRSLGGAPSDAPRLARPVSEIRIPLTVQAVLAACIDRLSERERRVLQTAAVVGKTFTEPLLRAVAALPAGDLTASLAALAQAEFIYEVSLYPVLEYTFKHPLTQEVAYRTQLREPRPLVHAAVARAVAATDAEKLGERAALLAYHCEAAGEAVEAARWHVQAAEWAGANAPQEALQHARAAMTLAASVPDSAETLGLGIEARFHLLNWGWRLGIDEAEATRTFVEARDLAIRLGDARSQIMLIDVYGMVLALSGAAPRALPLFEEGVVLADQCGDAQLRYSLRESAANARFSLGELAVALKLNDECLDLVRSELGEEAMLYWGGTTAWGYGARGVILTWMGRLHEARAALERCAALALRTNQIEMLSWVSSQLAAIAYFEDDGDGAPARARGT